MGGAVGDCNGLTENVVRYDSPTFGGFSVSASWGEDDLWDVAARYSGEYNGFKLAVAAAYNQVRAEDFCNASLLLVTCGFGIPAATTTLAPLDADYFQIGAYVEHVPTGLWLYGAYGKFDDDTPQHFGLLGGAERRHLVHQGRSA